MAKKSKKRGKKNGYQNILTRSNHVNCYSFFWVAFRIKVWLICWRTVKVEISSNSSNNGVGVKRLVVLGLREPENMKEDRFFFFLVCCYQRHYKSIPLNYFHHQNVKPYPITLPIPLLLNVQNNSPSPV